MKNTTTALFAIGTVVILGLLLMVYYQGGGSTTDPVTTDLTVRFYDADCPLHQGNTTTWSNATGSWTYTTVQNDDGSSVWVFENITGRSNVYDQLAAASQIAGFDILTEEYTAMGTIVTSIGGADNLEFSGRAWQFYVDGVYGTKACNLTPVGDGASVEWRYIPNQTS